VNISGTFKVIESVYEWQLVKDHVRRSYDYTIEGTASGSTKGLVGAYEQIYIGKIGRISREITSCPRFSYSNSATYTITGKAKNGIIDVRGTTHDFDGLIDKDHYRECKIEVWQSTSLYKEEKNTFKKKEHVRVDYEKGFGGSFREENNWEMKGETESSYWITKVEPIEIVNTCTIELKFFLKPCSLMVYGCDPEYRSGVSASLPKEGSDYQWSIIAGMNKAEIARYRWQNRIAIFKPIGASRSENDIVIQGSYVAHDGLRRTCRASLTSTVPTSLRVQDEHEIALHEKDGRWAMGVEREYQVIDHLGQPIMRKGLYVSERFTSIDVMGNRVTWESGSKKLSFNPTETELTGPGAPDFEFDAQNTYTDEHGTFPDTPNIWRNLLQFPDTTNCVIHQEIFVSKCLVRRNTIHILHDSIRIGP